MNFIQHSLCNAVLSAPTGVPIEQCRALPIMRNEMGISSFWLPTPEELAALNAGHPIVFTAQGSTHPPIRIDVCAVKS